MLVSSAFETPLSALFVLVLFWLQLISAKASNVSELDKKVFVYVMLIELILIVLLRRWLVNDSRMAR